ncbi:hypothetical protein AK812_SmicGene23134 [Symbiodinium microadriaticum]|uniref:Uncharacterized protein n=1 Tax=Symbiodinium microadriaticum TaxID=2951 RepID=A0A1Q9DI03_SYMMI|nr:hypothetical protein AK812_SmicGene23134 [Symbiodinium microadriaticum]
MAMPAAGKVEVIVSELKAVWRLEPDEVCGVDKPKLFTSGPFKFLDNWVEVEFHPTAISEGRCAYIRVRSDQRLWFLLRTPVVASSREMGTQFASSEFKWCADVDYKPAEVDCSKPIEITVLFGEGKENEMLVKQSLQFLERQTKKLNELEPELQSCRSEVARGFGASLRPARRLPRLMENLHLRAMHGVGQTGATQIAQWYQQMNVSKNVSVASQVDCLHCTGSTAP